MGDGARNIQPEGEARLLARDIYIQRLENEVEALQKVNEELQAALVEIAKTKAKELRRPPTESTSDRSLIADMVGGLRSPRLPRLPRLPSDACIVMSDDIARSIVTKSGINTIEDLEKEWRG